MNSGQPSQVLAEQPRTTLAGLVKKIYHQRFLDKYYIPLFVEVRFTQVCL